MALTRDDLTQALAPILESIIGMSNRLDGIDNRLDGIDNQLGNLNGKINNLTIQVKILAKKSENSVKGRSDELAVVPKDDGTDPVAAYPTSLEQLLVAGNELLPNGATNYWNKERSLALIREYDPGYETDNADEPFSSRRRRLHLAKLLGITTSQLNYAQMIL